MLQVSSVLIVQVLLLLSMILIVLSNIVMTFYRVMFKYLLNNNVKINYILIGRKV